MFGRRPEKPPAPSWLKWVIIGFVLLAIIGNLRKHSPVHQAVSQATHELAASKITHFSDYKNLIFPHPGATIRMKDISEGTGAAATCGQQATVAVRQIAPGGATTAAPSLTFRIGSGASPIEQGVIGMKKGGKRDIAVPPEMSDKHKAEHLELTLQSLTPPLPDPATSPYRIAVLTPGRAPAVACGQPVAVSLTLWSLDGKKLFSTGDAGNKPLTVTPGKSQLFLGLELGVLGIGHGGSRLLVVPPQFQHTLNGNKPAIDFPFPKDQTVLVEVETP